MRKICVLRFEKLAQNTMLLFAFFHALALLVLGFLYSSHSSTIHFTQRSREEKTHFLFASKHVQIPSLFCFAYALTLLACLSSSSNSNVVSCLCLFIVFISLSLIFVFMSIHIGSAHKFFFHFQLGIPSTS